MSELLSDISGVGFFLSLFTLGLMSGAHCIGMCGGIMGALTMAVPAHASNKRRAIVLAYNGGRITSYALIGLLAGALAASLTHWGGGSVLRIIAGVLLIAMGLYLADWWRGLTRLETLGRYIWVYIQPLGKGLMPVDNFIKAGLLGFLWGWLPCGLVYAALALAMTEPHPLTAAGGMLSFGLGTLPAVVVAGLAAQQLALFLQKRSVRVTLAALLIIFGVWTIWGAMGHQHGGHHHTNMPTPDGIDHSTMDHSTMDHSTMDHSKMDHSTMEHSTMDHSGMHHVEADAHSENSSQVSP